MKTKWIFVSGAVLIVFFLSFACVQNSPGNGQNGNSFPELTGEYFGQEPPGTDPELFASGMISTSRDFAITFSPDGKECFFTRDIDPMTIMTTREVDGKWTELGAAWFSGTYPELEPHIIPDGSRLFFGSERPFSDGSTPIFGIQQWYLEKTESGWSGLKPLESPFRDIFAMYVSVADNDSIYFTGKENGHSFIYRSIYIDGKYQEPEKLSNNINFRENAAHPFIAPDESYLIYDAVQDNITSGTFIADLYISFRNEDGTWSVSENLGNNINTSGNESCAFVSRDGNYLFFSRERNIYWVDASIIENLKPEELKRNTN